VKADRRLIGVVLALALVVTFALDLAGSASSASEAAEVHCPLHANPAIGAPTPVPTVPTAWHPLAGVGSRRVASLVAFSIFVPPRPAPVS
jgi:hypothetical protein